MKEVLRNKIFWIVSIIFAVIIFLVAINSNRTYQSSMDILFLPKSEVAVRNVEQIIANAKQVPLSLSFYNRLIENNPDIDDAAAELPDAKRNIFWNSKIETKQIGKSGAVRITIFAPDQMQAEILSRQSASSLVTVMSKYYNIKTDLDMRIIDGPIASQITKTNIFLWIFLSLIFGLILGFIVSILVRMNIGKIGNKKNDHQIEFDEQPTKLTNFSFPTFGTENRNTLPIEPENFFDFNIQKEQEIAAAKKTDEAIAIIEKKAAAPANLPIAEDDVAFDIEAQPEEKAHLIEEPVAEVVLKDTMREATAEEVKARLNKLLSGNMLK